MRPMTAKRRKSTVRLVEVRTVLQERCQGECERCGFPLNLNDDGTWQFEIHHRQRRTAGGKDDLTNCTAVHSSCHTLHRNSIHQDVDESQTTGWLVPSWADPAITQLIYKGRPALLDAFGSVVDLEVTF